MVEVVAIGVQGLHDGHGALFLAALLLHGVDRRRGSAPAPDGAGGRPPRAACSSPPRKSTCSCTLSPSVEKSAALYRPAWIGGREASTASSDPAHPRPQGLVRLPLLAVVEPQLHGGCPFVPVRSRPRKRPRRSPTVRPSATKRGKGLVRDHDRISCFVILMGSLCFRSAKPCLDEFARGLGIDSLDREAAVVHRPDLVAAVLGLDPAPRGSQGPRAPCSPRLRQRSGRRRPGAQRLSEPSAKAGIARPVARRADVMMIVRMSVSCPPDPNGVSGSMKPTLARRRFRPAVDPCQRIVRCAEASSPP